MYAARYEVRSMIVLLVPWIINQEQKLALQLLEKGKLRTPGRRVGDYFLILSPLSGQRPIYFYCRVRLTMYHST